LCPTCAIPPTLLVLLETGRRVQIPPPHVFKQFAGVYPWLTVKLLVALQPGKAPICALVETVPSAE
jgi:hypothetical protein